MPAPSPWKGEGWDGGRSYDLPPSSATAPCVALPPASMQSQPSPLQGEGAKVSPGFEKSKCGFTATDMSNHASLRIIVPALPRISNHTDFDALRLHPQIDFKFIGPDQDIPGADLIILPGSKSVRSDLAWLRAQGWDHALLRHLRYGGKVLGICGGFQMLGQQIHDPHGLEGAPGSMAGLHLLDVVTRLAPDKQLRRVTGRLALNHAPVTGYEIHHGVTHGSALLRPLVTLDEGNDGAISVDEHIIGTYLHGLFDSPPACSALLRWAGLGEVRPLDYPQLREQGIDRIADALEHHLDMQQINVLLGLNGA